jgi:hypothetical protein
MGQSPGQARDPREIWNLHASIFESVRYLNGRTSGHNNGRSAGCLSAKIKSNEAKVSAHIV